MAIKQVLVLMVVMIVVKSAPSRHQSKIAFSHLLSNSTKGNSVTQNLQYAKLDEIIISEYNNPCPPTFQFPNSRPLKNCPCRPKLLFLPICVADLDSLRRFIGKSKKAQILWFTGNHIFKKAKKICASVKKI